jgi:hypothetical protein
LLAGDALQALAFELLTPRMNGFPAAMQASCAACWRAPRARAGMAGGQAIDLASVGCADRRPVAPDAPPQDRRAAASQRDDGRGLRGPPPQRRRRWQTTARRWAGVSGGGRHPGRDGRLGHAGQDRRQGRCQRQAHLCVAAGLERAQAHAQELLARPMRRWPPVACPTRAPWRRWPTWWCADRTEPSGLADAVQILCQIRPLALVIYKRWQLLKE